MKNSKANPVQVTAQPDNTPAGVTEAKPGHNIDADEANASAGENNAPNNDTTAKAPDEVTKPANRKVSLPIHADYELSQVMLKTVEQQAKILLPGLARGFRYTTKQICGKAFWKMLSKGEKIVAGICMARLVATYRLPLIEAGSNASHAKVYELR